MLTPEKQLEIARRSMDAAHGYTLAAINAVFETNSRSLKWLDDFAAAMLPMPPPAADTWEWSGAPRRPHSSLLSANQRPDPSPPSPFSVWSEMMRSSGQTWLGTVPSPFAWWAWTPQSAVPATWPWAYGMMSTGVPGSVAWPMAEANVALLDAATKTAEAARPVFPAYQSGSGFSAQVWVASPVMKSVIAAMPATSLMWPWLERAA